MGSVKDILDRALSDGIMTYQEHEEFIEMVHKDGVIDAEESEQISRIFRLIQAGQLQIVDEDRETFADKKRAESLRKA